MTFNTFDLQLHFQPSIAIIQEKLPAEANNWRVVTGNNKKSQALHFNYG